MIHFSVLLNVILLLLHVFSDDCSHKVTKAQKIGWVKLLHLLASRLSLRQSKQKKQLKFKISNGFSNSDSP